MVALRPGAFPPRKKCDEAIGIAYSKKNSLGQRNSLSDYLRSAQTFWLNRPNRNHPRSRMFHRPEPEWGRGAPSASAC